jgi:uncharacterized protein (TIGR02246 family)
MKPMLATAVRAISMFVLVTGLATGAQAQGNAGDEAAIRKVIVDGIAAFNRHDAKAGTAFFTEDADFVTVYGKWSKGAAEIERSRQQRFETALKDARIELLDLRVRFIEPDVAIAHETHDLSGMRGPDGAAMPTLRELSIRVLVKREGKWLVTAFHNTVVKPAADIGAASSQR